MTPMKETAGTDEDFSMKGRIALITGAQRGIGAAVARRFVASGGRVAVTHLGTEATARDAAALTKDLGQDKLLAIVADTADAEAMRAAAAKVAASFGDGPDTLVVNATAVGKHPWDQITLADWDHMMQVNLRGAFVAALSAVPAMREKKYGKVIVIGSVMAHIGDPRALHYVTSKEGLIGFTRSLARAEGANGIRVNCVVPGSILTEQHFEEGGKVELGRL
ncbi:MAG: SDR family NAD(P)-dependent oxidoreductase, partial [Alphaproteobacteria bacterium]|nr:SDR family NAD(P)-dependent oxidoreductase [Alphaproteobacteria bacterium]